MSKKESFTKNSIYSILGFLVLTSANLGFQAFAGRKLGVVEWGIFGAFFNLLLAFAQPLNSFQLAVAKYRTNNSLNRQDMFSALASTLFLFSLIIIFVFVAGAGVLKGVFNLPHATDVMVGGAVLVFWMILAGIRGVYQGGMDFKAYGINLGVEGVFRMSFGMLFLFLGWKIAGALGASLASGLLAMLLLISKDIKLFGRQFFRFHFNKDIVKGFGSALMILLPFGLIMSLDTTLVQHFISGKEAGYITACSVFGKNLIMMSMVFSNVIFSYTLKSTESSNAHSFLWWGIVITSIVFTGAAVAMFPLGEWTINTLMGVEFAPAASYLPLYIMMALPLAVMLQIFNFSVAKNIKVIKILAWVLVVALGVLYSFVLQKQDINHFLRVALISLTVVDVILMLILVPILRNEQKVVD